jgi:uncharacterized membrane protein
MKTWLRELEKALNKKFYKEETEGIVSFYQEMIEDRISQGENFEEIVKDYQIDQIVKSMTPEVLSKRDNNTYKRTAKSMGQLTSVLLSTPLLIPLGIIYIILLVIGFSMIVSIFGIAFGAIVGLGSILLNVANIGIGTGESVALIGAAIIGFAVAILVCLIILKIVWEMSKLILNWFVKIARKGEKNEMVV